MVQMAAGFVGFCQRFCTAAHHEKISLAEVSNVAEFFKSEGIFEVKIKVPNDSWFLPHCVSFSAVKLFVDFLSFVFANVSKTRKSLLLLCQDFSGIVQKLLK